MLNMENLKKRTLFWGVITLLSYLFLFFCIDKPVDIYIHNNLTTTWIHSTGEFISFFASSMVCVPPLILSLLLIIVYDRHRKHKWIQNLFFICITISVAMIIGQCFKIILARYRPLMLFDKNLYGFHLFSHKWIFNSTPSGHAIRAFSLFSALSLINKKRMPLYIFLAIVVGISRVAVTDHYPSDVIFGAFIGIFTALWLYKLTRQNTSNMQ